MKIILEGCDCVGKTSTIENLKKYFNNDCIIKHFSNPPKNLSQQDQHNFCKIEYFNELNFSCFNVPIIYDRYYFGEQIYAPIYRKYSPNYINELENRLNDENALLILLVADIKDLHKRFDGIFIKKEQMDKIQETYINLFEKCNLKNKIQISTSKYNVDEVAKIIYDKYKSIIL